MSATNITHNQPGSSDRVRLHISPFNPELLDTIIVPSIQPLATNVSFHTVQTFPDRGFGFVELPAMEAQKLKNKLHGSTLRGAKVRIEHAKPEKKREADTDEHEADRKVRRMGSKKDAKKREDGVIPGFELEEGRRVKRGWTENRASKTRSAEGVEKVEGESSLHGKRLRFKTTISPIVTPTEAQSRTKTRQNKSGDEKISKKDKKKVVVEEFGKTTKPSPTSVDSEAVQNAALSYEDSRGWVDQDGNVVEAERSSTKLRRTRLAQSEEQRISAIESRESVDGVRSSTPAKPTEDEDMSLDDAITDDIDGADLLMPSGRESEIHQPIPERATDAHALETLFKRPTSSASDSKKHRPKPINTSFSFFGPEESNDDENGMESAIPPQTPHTKRDLEWRGMRSAAPTPDTAALGRRMSFPVGPSDDEEDDDETDEDVKMADAEQANSGATSIGEKDGGEESTFRKWFYANRGDLNRGWKKRRREGRKQNRQRENRQLSKKMA